jgi:hypothetical protein
VVATATTWPLAARAQQAERMRRIGVLVGLAEDDPFIKERLAGFREGLDKLGWSEGRNVGAQAQALARELVARQPDVWCDPAGLPGGSGGSPTFTFLISLRNRLIVATQWLWSYVTFERGARHITGMNPKVETVLSLPSARLGGYRLLEDRPGILKRELLIDNGTNFRDFSECALMQKENRSARGASEPCFMGCPGLPAV